MPQLPPELGEGQKPLPQPLGGLGGDLSGWGHFVRVHWEIWKGICFCQLLFCLSEKVNPITSMFVHGIICMYKHIFSPNCINIWNPDPLLYLYHALKQFVIYHSSYFSSCHKIFNFLFIITNLIQTYLHNCQHLYLFVLFNMKADNLKFYSFCVFQHLVWY